MQQHDFLSLKLFLTFLIFVQHSSHCTTSLS